MKIAFFTCYVASIFMLGMIQFFDPTFFGWASVALLVFGSVFLYSNSTLPFFMASKVERYRYQKILKQAALGMGRIKDLRKLTQLIMHILTRTTRIEECAIYVFISRTQKFELKAQRGFVRGSLPVDIACDRPFIDFFYQTLAPIDCVLCSDLKEDLSSLSASFIVPCFSAKALTAFVVLGKKKGREAYYEEETMFFSVLANQVALAIENARYYDDIKKTQDQLFEAEKMVTVGTMADGVAHQVNNRFHCLGLISSDALDSIKRRKKDGSPIQDEKLFLELEEALKHIQNNIVLGRDVVKGLLQYTRRGEEAYSPTDVAAAFHATLNMLRFKIHLQNFELLRDFPNDLPRIKANASQLQEVFFNIVDNAYDSMMQRKMELQEEGYQPKLQVRAFQEGEFLKMVFQDNGLGVKAEDKSRLFAPLFTTKTKHKKGTGLGLYVMKKIVEKNHGGNIIFKSEYEQGATLTLTLPLNGKRV